MRAYLARATVRVISPLLVSVGILAERRPLRALNDIGLPHPFPHPSLHHHRRHTRMTQKGRRGIWNLDPHPTRRNVSTSPFQGEAIRTETRWHGSAPRKSRRILTCRPPERSASSPVK